MTRGRHPSDARAFLAEAERATNAFDAEACAAVYANNATLTSITDGARESFRGAREIAWAWRVYTRVLERIGLQLQKRLIVAAEDVVTNSWAGTSRAGREACGFEEWHFDKEARVIEHSMWSSLSIAAPTDPSFAIRSLVTQPRAAIAFLRARLAVARVR